MSLIYILHFGDYDQEYPVVPFVMVCTTLIHVSSLSMSYTNAVVIFVESHLYIQVVKLPFIMCSIKQLHDFKY